MGILFRLSGVVVLLSLFACGDGGSDAMAVAPDASTPDAAGSAGAAAPSDAGHAPADAGPAAPQQDAAANPDTLPDADTLRPQTNVSFETAKPLQADGTPILQDERSADQVDYYVFSGEEGDFFELTTDRGQFMPDNVISLYDSEYTLIAQNDEGQIWPGDGIDARLVVRLPKSGDYYVTVEDPWTPAAFFDSEFPLLYYHLRLRALTAGAEGVALASGDGPTDVQFAEDPETGYAYATLLGELSSEQRAFMFSGKANQALIGHLLASGESGNGSTALGGEIQILDGDLHVLAQIDRALGQDGIDPPVQDASYQLTLSTAESDIGDNPFYAVDVVLIPDNPAEQHDAENGVIEAAEPVQMEGSTWRRGLLLLQVPPGDVDYFSLEVNDGDHVSAACEGESGGSGVRGLSAELRDASDNVLASANETSEANLSIDPISVTEAGTVYLRVSSDAPADSSDIEPWARCAVNAGP